MGSGSGWKGSGLPDSPKKGGKSVCVIIEELATDRKVVGGGQERWGRLNEWVRHHQGILSCNFSCGRPGTGDTCGRIRLLISRVVIRREGSVGVTTLWSRVSPRTSFHNQTVEFLAPWILLVRLVGGAADDGQMIIYTGTTRLHWLVSTDNEGKFLKMNITRPIP